MVTCKIDLGEIQFFYVTPLEKLVIIDIPEYSDV